MGVGVGVGMGMGMVVREAHWTCPYQFAMSILTHPTPFGAGLNLVHMRRSLYYRVEGPSTPWACVAPDSQHFTANTP